jgi:hypothetical protein
MMTEAALIEMLDKNTKVVGVNWKHNRFEVSALTKLSAIYTRIVNYYGYNGDMFKELEYEMRMTVDGKEGYTVLEANTSDWLFTKTGGASEVKVEMRCVKHEKNIALGRVGVLCYTKLSISARFDKGLVDIMSTASTLDGLKSDTIKLLKARLEVLEENAHQDFGSWDLQWVTKGEEIRFGKNQHGRETLFTKQEDEKNNKYIPIL